jgi:hypothetical protein
MKQSNKKRAEIGMIRASWSILTRSLNIWNRPEGFGWHRVGLVVWQEKNGDRRWRREH